MDLRKIAAKIFAKMPAAKANKLKCTFSFSTTLEGSQYLYFTVFFIDGNNHQINKSLVFYEFHNDEQHTEKLQKIDQYLQGGINEYQLFNIQKQ